MKHILFILVLFNLTCGHIHAQVRLFDAPRLPKDTLDYSRIRCLYEQSVLSDTLISHKQTKSIMYLQIGNEISKYMSFINFQTDSLISDDIRKGNNINLLEAIKNGRYQMGSDHILLFKNFPKYKNTVGNRIVYDSYIYEEDIVTPKWKIEKEQVTILGYSCTKATTRFCGRNYTVWFSPDIPVSEGPWKFTGLPGLILRVHDDKGEVTFECTQIQNVGWSDPILKSVSNPQTIKTTKKKFYDQLKKYCDNPSGFIENNTRVTSTAPKRILPKKMYNPIELFE